MISILIEHILVLLAWFIIVDEIRDLCNKSYVKPDYSKLDWRLAYICSMFAVASAITFLINYYKS